MSDKHEAKQKQMRAKAHVDAGKVTHGHGEKNSHLDTEIKEAAGEVQEELTPFRASANKAHQG